ncbi:MAG: C25 family cysteine peptidase [candidate division WOR-3 bacterium]
MKKSLTIIFLTMVFVKTIFSDQVLFKVNIEDEIKKNNFYYEKNENGDLYIEKVIDLKNYVEIESIDYEILSYEKKIYGRKHKNPDISLDGKVVKYKDEPKKYVESITIGKSGTTKIIVKIFPYLENLNKEFSVKEILIKINLQQNYAKPVSSFYDFIFTENVQVEKSLKDYNSNLDLLIITQEKFIPYFKNFINLNRGMGFITQIVSTEEIVNNSTGSDNSEKIRNFIKKLYHERGLRFVLLGGSIEIVPTRFIYSNTYYYYGSYPSDIYYSDIDGSWNRDGDEIIGEIDDIEDGFSDLCVTRLPFINEQELNNILEKFENYIFKQDVSKIKNFLLAGASLLSDLSDGSGQLLTNNILSLYDIYTYNNYTLFSPIVDTFHAFPYYTGNSQLNRINFIQKISEGFYFINHIDHSNDYFLGTGLYETKTKCSNWDTLSMYQDNGNLSIMFSLGCSPNAFDRISISKSLLVSKKSPIISFTGFVRTGWTSAENYMLNFWRKMLSKDTRYITEALIYANLNPNIYFRTAINTCGFPTLPIYSENIDSFIIQQKNLNDSIKYYIADSKGNRKGFLVTLFSDRKVYFRNITDENGYVSFPNILNDSILYVGIFSKDHRLKIDTIFYETKKIDIKVLLVSDTNLISITLKNPSSYDLFFDTIKFLKKDKYLFVEDSVKNLNIKSFDSTSLLIKYKRLDINENFLNQSVFFSTVSGNNIFVDSLTFHLENDSFKIHNFELGTNNFNIVFSKVSSNYIDSFNLKLKSSNSDLTILDSLFSFKNIKRDSIINLNSIKFQIKGNNEILDSSYILALFVLKNDTDTICIKMKNQQTNITLKLFQTEEGIKIYHNLKNGYGELYKVNDNDTNLISKLDIDENFFLDTNITFGANKYFGVFYDKIGRVIDTTDLCSLNISTKMNCSKTLLTSSYFGKLNGKMLYAKSSFNYGDFNRDGYNEILVLSDDGRVLILNKDFNNITPFELTTLPYQETTPVVGDLDRNGYLDIVLANGYFQTDTSGFLILNIFSSQQKILPIKGYGIFTASPVLEDINKDGSDEIIIGTSSGIHVLDKNLNNMFSKNIVNICGISVCKDIEKIFANDFYGKVYCFDFSGANLDGFPLNINHLTFSPILVVDLENDGVREILVSTVDNYIFAIEENGRIKTGFPVYTNSPVYSSPKATDIDNDGKKEIVTLNKNGYLYIHNYKGENKKTFNTGFYNNFYNEPLIYDYDGNGNPEIILFTNNGYLVSYSSYTNGCDTLFYFNTTFTSTPAIISFNNSNNFNIVSKDLYGKIYKIETVSRGAKKVLFGKVLYDNKNSSYITGEILRLDQTDRKGFTKDIEKVKVEYTIGKNKLYVFNNLYDNLELKIFNVAGMELYSKNINKIEICNEIELNLPSGKYFYQLNYLNKTIEKDKILILKK